MSEEDGILIGMSEEGGDSDRDMSEEGGILTGI